MKGFVSEERMAGSRFKLELPPGMAQLNYTLVQTLVPPGLQSVEEIEEIVHQATRAGGSYHWDPAYRNQAAVPRKAPPPTFSGQPQQPPAGPQHAQQPHQQDSAMYGDQSYQ